MATVKLEPTSDAYIPGVAAVPCEVDEETAAYLLSFSPPAFVVAAAQRKPAKGPAPTPSDPEPPADPIDTEA